MIERPERIEIRVSRDVDLAEIEDRCSRLRPASAFLVGAPTPPGWVPVVMAGQEFDDEHRYVLRAYRRSHGRPTVGTGMPTAAEVNEAVDWWNERQEVERG